MGATTFDNFVRKKLHAVAGDVTENGLGMSMEDRNMVLKHSSIIIHCAGQVDASEHIDISVKVNALGVINVMAIANECGSLSGLIHLSPLQSHNRSSFGTLYEDKLSPLPNAEPETLLTNILSAELQEMPSIMEDIKPYYPNSYMFSKSLAEHLLVRDVQKKQINSFPQYPIAIMRLGPLGPSLAEPLMGWADNVNGANGLLLLTGRGIRVIQANQGENPVDIIPVDFAVRLILGCVANLSIPKQFAVPSPLQHEPFVSADYPSYRESTTATSVSIRDSAASSEEASFYRSSAGSRASSHTSAQIDSLGPKEITFPSIYHISSIKMRPVSWRVAYDAIRQYWMQTTNVRLIPAEIYFSNDAAKSPAGLSRARTVMNSLRSAATSYITGVPTANTSMIDPISKVPGKRNSHRFSRCVDKAVKAASHLRGSFGDMWLNTVDTNTSHLKQLLRKDSAAVDFDPHELIPEDASVALWKNYFMNASYGIHYFVGGESNLRLPSPISEWDCALHNESEAATMVDKPTQSSVYSAAEVTKRTERMVHKIKDVLIDNIQHSKETDDEWLTDMDDSLEDWCQDPSIVASEREKRMVFGKWRKKVGSNDEAVKVVVLNDKRVNVAVHKITQNAGVSKQTAVNEATKILLRMSERTQLAFVCFTGFFLKSLFENMFENIRIREEHIRQIRDATLGKRVVYVPVAKSILDPLLLWYITIRFQLPVPALACDEAMAQLGSISDIYRLAGAYYMKRDKRHRSPLNSAVLAAYTQVLLREHGALCFSLEKTRSRSGKYDEPYADGLIDMVIEATLQSNQSRTPAFNKLMQSETTPPTSPDTPVSAAPSPTASIDGHAGLFRKAHRDIVFVPINISYENVPELPHLIDEVLDQQPRRQTQELQTPMEGVVRPSEAMDKRTKMLEGAEVPRKRGRVLLGIGSLISVQDTAEEFSHIYDSSTMENFEVELAKELTNKIQKQQRRALIITPISLVSAIILYGRATGGVCVGKIKELMLWLREEFTEHGYHIDWQDGEDLDSIVLYVFRLLEDSKNLIIEGKEINDDTNIRVNDHADNVMTLSYYANQIVDALLSDAFMAAVYLSFTEDIVTEDEFMDRFRFLVQMLEREFVCSWDVDKQFNKMIDAFEERKIIRKRQNQSGVNELCLAVNMELHPTQYEQLIFLASVIYPTIDSYWITSCSLSALEAVPMLPRSIAPLLSQWIATHLIAGRRTIYREVLSTESSRTAIDVFMALGFLGEFQAKERLSPDAQILLHELGVPTSESLIELSGQNSDGGMTPVSPVDPEGMMKAIMAQIQMNRANSNMADLCQQIDSYRLGAASQRESFQNAQVFQKCLKQIKGILHTGASFAQRRKIELKEPEDKLVQLVYALRVNSASSAHTAQGRALRRISEAYNLR
ncbi:male sterility protein-domain-containing protein [Radiomyces spectabilis]|uniref:male sterility protein-domain-containing protein n=1 Tax=Radiomyces spectabilis TaxID=64574 RepID=UPI00221EC70B|nr:male sterility protein-domain-containing protein [Radiomyces spectabilis]KAI8374462.1 male sterility protein-domain-containing protein [Radiomyces spectabilis]